MPLRTLTRILPLAASLLILAAVLLPIALRSPFSWNDAGMYENILRSYLATGRVDYMHFCQPTYIGLLPVAVPWAAVFGTSTPSVQVMNVVYMVAAGAGIYCYAVRRTSPATAAFLALVPLGFGEVVLNASAFMTDTPYLAYLVWFIVVTERLEALYTSPATGRPAGGRRALLWGAWVGLLMLAVLTRTFALLALFLLGVYLHYRRRAATEGGERRFAVLALVAGGASAVACFLLIKALSVNPFPTDRMTNLAVILRGQVGILHVRHALSWLLQSAVLVSPALLLSRPAGGRPTRFEMAAAVGGLLFAGFCWRVGSFLDTAAGVPGHDLTQLAAVFQLLWVPPVVVILWRMTRELARPGALGADASLFLLVGFILAQVAVATVMQTPFFRHFAPVGVLLVMLAPQFGAMASLRSPRGALVAALWIVFAAYTAIVIRGTRDTEAVAFEAGRRLTRSGVPAADVDAGWGWFAYERLKPEFGDPDFSEPERARFRVRMLRVPAEWARAFPFSVPWAKPALPERAEGVIRRERVRTPLGAFDLVVTERAPEGAGHPTARPRATGP